MKCATLARFGHHPNFAPMTIYYATADGQPNTGSGIVFLIMQTLEYFKNLLVIFRGNANTVVAY